MDTREPPGRASPARSIEWRAGSPAAPLKKILVCLDRMSREEDGRGHGHRILETLIALKGNWYLMPGRTLGHLKRVAALPEMSCLSLTMMDFIVMLTGCSGTCQTRTIGAGTPPCWTSLPRPPAHPPTRPLGERHGGAKAPARGACPGGGR